ncbi:MAG TPA: VWA domain-containing protein [Burkholderiaceae bacterium]|jgi:uncharacterized protein with von Willebrand factor type A (vWA) domain|nr:VWA domain-containing protein [Burkholderiaceae bacterium]
MSPRPLEALAGFAAYLRDHGLGVGIAESQAMVAAALAVRIEDCERLRAGWRSIVCHCPPEWRKYPDLFEAYWFPNRLKGTVKTSGQTRPRRDLRQVVASLQDDLDAQRRRTAQADVSPAGTATTGFERPGERARGGASRCEALANRDFCQWLPQDLSQLERIVEALAQRLRRRALRRLRNDARGRRLDVRRTLRASLRTGGEPFVPAWRRPRSERPRMFVLVDVSRSMETYAQLFLRIARAFVGILDARVFVFHTRLTEITPLLASDSGRVQEKINAVTAGFGGGTRIATSLADFVNGHARHALSRRARLLILSDGFDTDPPDQLARELGRVKRRGTRIYWLHPTRDAAHTAALASSREFIDRFAPLYNLDSLARLGEIFGQEAR